MKNTKLIIEAMSENKIFKIEYNLSNHAILRCQQRGITKQMILTVILDGNCIEKQGMSFYYLSPNFNLETKEWSGNKSLKNLIVITNESNQSIITCYWNYKGLHHIKKKPKMLLTNYAA